MKKLLLIAMGAALAAGSAYAEETDAPDFSGTLTGDWNGLRTKLHNDGLDFTAAYHAGLWRNFSGGIRTGNAFNDDLDLQLAIDSEKLYGLQGSSAFIYILNNNGGKPNADLVGSVGGIDNIEVVKARPKLFEAWVQQNAFDDKLSALAGLYAIDSEFYITDASALFLNPTYGFGTEAGTTGVAGPAIFPESAAGTRIAIKPFQDIYLQAAITAGSPSQPGDPNGLRFGFGPDAGAILAAEAGYKNDDNGHYALGVWHYTQDMDRFDGAGTDSDTGWYAMAERALLIDPKNPDRKLSGFIRLGFADKNVSPYDFSWAAGVSAVNVIPSRKDSQAGFAIAQTRMGDDFRDSIIASGGASGKTETQFELTYSDNLLPWLSVQPDLQYTVNPAMDPGLDNAWTGGIRLGVSF